MEVISGDECDSLCISGIGARGILSRTGEVVGAGRITRDAGVVGDGIGIGDVVLENPRSRTIVTIIAGMNRVVIDVAREICIGVI